MGECYVCTEECYTLSPCNCTNAYLHEDCYAKLIACKYIDNNGSLAKERFPQNPNGSIEDIAGITNVKGNVLAMMPHPERAMYFSQRPDWISQKYKIKKKLLYKEKLYADGYKIFRNAHNYFK